MAIAVNAVGTAHRTVAEVKEKWTNLKEQQNMSFQSSVRNKGELVVAHRQKCHPKAPTKFWNY